VKKRLITPSHGYFSGSRLAQMPYNSCGVRPARNAEEPFHVKPPEFCVVSLLVQHKKM